MSDQSTDATQSTTATRGMASFTDRTSEGITIDGTGEGDAWDGVYRCPFCPFEEAREEIVRAHICYETEGKHKNRNGFLDQINVQILDDDGDVIGDVDSPLTTRDIGGPRIADEPIDRSLIPDGVREGSKAERILFEAITNPGASPSALAKRVAEDPGDVTKSDASYASTVIRTHLKTPDEDDDDDTDARRMDHKGFYDLTEKQRRIIIAKVADPSPSRSISDVQSAAGGDMAYSTTRSALKNYDNIVRHLNAKLEAGSISMDRLIESAAVDEHQMALPMRGKRWSKETRQKARHGSYPTAVDSTTRTGVKPIPEASGVPGADAVDDDDTDDDSDLSPIDVDYVLDFARKLPPNATSYDDGTEIVPSDIDVEATIRDYRDLNSRRKAMAVALIATQLDPDRSMSMTDVSEAAGTPQGYASIFRRDYLPLVKRLTVLVLADALTLRDMESMINPDKDHDPKLSLVDLGLPNETDPRILQDPDQEPEQHQELEAPPATGQSQPQTTVVNDTPDQDPDQRMVRVGIDRLRDLATSIDTIRSDAQEDMELADEGSPMWIAAKKQLSATDVTAEFLREIATEQSGDDR